MARVALIGLPGSGKSTVGPLLGEALHAAFVDVDQILEESSGWSPGEWVENRGWETFRSAESVTLESLHKSLQSQSDVILGCGGGVVEVPSNREILKQWICIWLDASDEVLLERTRDSVRPLQPGLTHAESARHLRSRREQWYRELGVEAVNTSDLDPGEVVTEVLKHLERS